MDISIIVPVYNAESYIIKCLDSLFSQIFNGSFEVITVDDASTDNSLLILKNYQQKESRLKIIKHDFNRKQAVARVTGMNAALGDYIMHVDSDDWLLPGALERLLNESKKNNPDVILFNYIVEDSSGRRIPSIFIKDEILTTNKLLVQKYFYGNSATKFVKRSLTEKMITGQNTIHTSGDDFLYCTEILLRAKSILLLPETYYVYFINKQSLTQSSSPALMLQYIFVLIPIMRKITLQYSGHKDFINNILVYFEKNIFDFSLQYWLTNYKPIKNSEESINILKLFPEMTEKRLNAINLAVRKRRYSFYFNYINYGPRFVISVVINVLYNRMKFLKFIFST